MDISQLTIRILLLIVPGMIATSLYEFITRKNMDTRKYICSTIFSSFLCYLLVLLAYNMKDLILNGVNGFSTKKIVFFDALLYSDIQINYNEIIIASVFGFLLGLLKTILMNKGWIFKILMFFKLTTETGNDVWAELFENNTKGSKDFVYIVKAKENRVYGGAIRHFSRDASNPELELVNVVVYENENRKNELYKVDSVYFNLKNEDITIEIIKNEQR